MKALLTFDRADGRKAETLEIDLMAHDWPDTIRQRLAHVRPDWRVDCVTITRVIPLKVLGRVTESRSTGYGVGAAGAEALTAAIAEGEQK